MVYTVTFNPALDYVVRMDGFRTGDINRTRSEEVQVIGTKFVLYRQHYDKSRRKIELVKDRRPAGQ